MSRTEQPARIASHSTATTASSVRARSASARAVATGVSRGGVPCITRSGRRSRRTRRPRWWATCRSERVMHGTPPRLTRVATALALAERARTDDAVVAVLCDAVRADCSVLDMRGDVSSRGYVRQRRLLVDLLAEVSEGVESPMEHRYHRDVERRHDLPRAVLQVRQRVERLWIRADAVYRGRRVRVELDGKLAHPDGR